jgi:hypothetical protein
VEWNRGFAL